MVTAVFNGEKVANAYGLWQWDYGQVLRIQGLSLDPAVEIHFSLSDKTGESITRIGVTKDGVTEVVIPESMLENGETRQNYNIYAWIYLADNTSGKTIRKIVMSVTSRPKPEAFQKPEDAQIFRDAIKAVNDSAIRSAESEKQAEGWAHGREDLPERAEDNAKYYADQARQDAEKTKTDRKEVERLVESVSDIDQQVSKVEDLTKQAQTSATNAALSEWVAKTSETNAQTAQAGAETAEGNAELAERNAKASEQAVEKAKQLVSQMGQDVLDNKNYVDQTVHDFELTTQQALADVNNAGQTQTDRVQSAGETAVENIQTAQNTATKAVETAKAEAAEAVQTEGSAQTENVTKEGKKQIQAVQTAAQEIVGDREQIQTNKTDIEALKQGKADAIVDTSSGENITLTDSDAEPFRGLRIFGKSTQDGTPTPENPVPIVNVGDKGTIEVGVTGKNLIPFPYRDKSKVTNNVTVTIQDDGRIILNGIASGSVNIDLFLGKILLKDRVTYAVSNNLNVKINDNATVNNSYTAKKGDYISHIWYWYASGTVFNNVLLEPQIEIASKITSYEPYKEPQTLTIQTPNGLPGIKVDSDGNYTDSNGQQWVRDEVDLERGKYVQRIWEKIFDGSEEWFAYTTSPYDGFSVRCLPELMQKREGLCTFTQVLTYSRIAESMWIGANNDYIYYIKNPLYNSDLADKGLANWKAHLAKKPMKVMTYLTAPIERDLIPEEIAAYKALHTNYPTTIISNDESAHMEVAYVADTKNYIEKVTDTLQKQITELQKALISQKISGGV